MTGLDEIACNIARLFGQFFFQRLDFKPVLFGLFKRRTGCFEACIDPVELICIARKQLWVSYLFLQRLDFIRQARDRLLVLFQTVLILEGQFALLGRRRRLRFRA